MKEGGEVKKIIAAWIEQILEFPSEEEYQAYIKELCRSPKKFKVLNEQKLEGGSMLIVIAKQYNNNNFPDRNAAGELV